MDSGLWGHTLSFSLVCCNCSKPLLGTTDLRKKPSEGAVRAKARRRGALCVEGSPVPCFLDRRSGPSVPTAVHLLGGELVVWKDLEGEWRVFLDKCPHRLAPLSVSKLDLISYSSCWDVWSFCFCDCTAKLGHHFEVWGSLTSSTSAMARLV